MSKEEMEQISNETLADYMTPKRGDQFSQSPWDFNATNHDLAMAEIARRLRDGMYWQPMTSESKFEDGEAYLLRDREDGGAVLGSWQQYPYGFSIKAERYLEDRKQYTHYARITEPN